MTDTPALRPPEKWKHVRWHWISTTDHPTGQPAEWINDKCWWLTDDDDDWWPDKVPSNWTYIGPCDPAAIVPDPGDEAMVAVCAKAFGTIDRCVNEKLPEICVSSDICQCKIQARAMLTALRDMAKGGGNE